MKILDLGVIEYKKFLRLQEKLTQKRDNYLLLATHYPIYTVGISQKELFPFALPVKRGGSITYFDEGTLMVYFVFNVSNPPYFFKNIRKAMDKFFKNFNLKVYYDKSNPGYYIENRKIASIGLSYSKNRSNHGVSIHVNPNLENFNKIKPCNLSNIKATSLYNEGVDISIEKAKELILCVIKDIYETKS